MRVIKPGLLAFDGQRLLVTAWHFDCEGRAWNDLDMAACALEYVGQLNGLVLTVAEPEAPINIQRIAAAELARVAARDRPRPWWRFWSRR